MKDHLHESGSAAVYYPEQWRSDANMSEPCPDFSIVFKELFSLAALDLANQIHQPLEALGTLFEEPLETGRQPRRAGLAKCKGGPKIEPDGIDMEKCILPSFLSAGKFLFVIRQVNKNDVAQFAAAGFRFAPVTQISTALSKTMELPTDELAAQLQHMQAQSVSENLLPAGVHLSCFVLRPRIRQGFDLLVPATSHNQLPTVQLPYDELRLQQLAVLEKLDNQTVSQMLEWLELNAEVGLEIEVDFRRDLLRAVTQLIRQIEDPWILQAKFSARTVEAPCRPQSQVGGIPKRCLLFSIHMMSTIYTPSPRPDFVFIPLRSFIVQQQVYMGSVDQEAFARQAYLDFSHCFESSAEEEEGNSRHSSYVPIIPTKIPESTKTSQWRRSGSLQRSHDGARPSSSTPEKMANSPSGAIVVSNRVTVNFSNAAKPPKTTGFEGEDEMGTIGRASIATVETETYVDKLFVLCRGS
jgi:hypothetical protein